MRVNELFMWCTDRGAWSTKPADLDPCLVFATVKVNVTTPKKRLVTIGDMSRKHVGIWTKGFGHNYHNGSHGKEGVDKDGISFFENLYGNGTMVFYGAFAK